MTDWLLEQTRGPAIDLTTMVAPSVEVEKITKTPQTTMRY